MAKIDTPTEGQLVAIPQGIGVPISVEGNDWEQWRARMWNQMVAKWGHPGLAPLEQYMMRSAKEKRCVECGAPGVVSHESVIIASVKAYWMCQECDSYWRWAK